MTMENTDDLRIEQIKPLIPPAILMEEIPMSESAAQTVACTRESASAALKGTDDRLVVVVGPCSIHDIDAAQEYADKLKLEAQRLTDDLIIIMRVYFEKPRTTVGWKGLINDPDLNNSFNINKGLRAARGLLAYVTESGLGVGCEFLDTISPQFIADFVSWGAIGARTTESQIHRELASGLSAPIGFKNGTNGNVQIAVDAIRSSCSSHHFLSVTKQGLSAIVETRGNDCCHVILRGGSNGTNYDADSINTALELVRKNDLAPRLMVDCSHGNSEKDHKRQPLVADAIAEQISAGSTDIFGVMIESHLTEGNQKYSDNMTYGQSITDACVSWEDTIPMLDTLAKAVRTRRSC
ncbi:MAG: 3-deoxy-7-phosphoheptulonate synthase [Planctomycetes bacterium]|nr:3-deoxy-7-phosphoheptulonate synthase [Planctomycetota bacterium]